MIYSFPSAARALSKKNWIMVPIVSSVMAHEINLPHLLALRAVRSTGAVAMYSYLIFPCI